MNPLQRHAVITGAASGLGAAAAARLLASGAKVVISDIDAQRASAMASMLDPQGTSATSYPCDIASAADLKRLVEHAEQFFGRPIDIFLANAGVGFSGSLLDATPDEIQTTIAVNVTGSLLSAQAALQSLVKAPQSSLIFTCSLQGVSGRAQRSVYTASKHAIVGMVKSLALEFGPQGVRVNAIAPTATDTPHLRQQLAKVTDTPIDDVLADAARNLPLGHLPDPDDFAEAVLFLSSAKAKSITGHVLLIDCGASAGKM